MRTKIKVIFYTLQLLYQLYEELQEKLEIIDENTDLSKLVKELKKMQENLDIKE